MRGNFKAIFALPLVVLTGAFSVASEPAAKPRPVVLASRLENAAVTPITAQFIQRAIKEAERDRAACLVIVLDTPGGLVDSTRDVVRHVLRSDVPVVVYVAPQGARAASAGVFITLSAHVAAMAPGTHIGAAHPVQIGGLPGSPGPASPRDGDSQDRPREATPLEEKSLNDTVAWARTLAELRGRNAEWAERAVKESLSAPAAEALREGAIDLVADDLSDLLEKIDGRQVRLARGQVHLQTAGAEVRTLEMWWGERALGALANPNVAFLLLILGFYGILFELNSPGWGGASARRRRDDPGPSDGHADALSADFVRRRRREQHDRGVSGPHRPVHSLPEERAGPRRAARGAA